jgi:hypothetical protein
MATGCQDLSSIRSNAVLCCAATDEAGMRHGLIDDCGLFGFAPRRQFEFVGPNPAFSSKTSRLVPAFG